MTKATYMRKRKELLAQLADLDAQPIDEPKPRQIVRRRVPTWCRPWWERRDGRQHIVYCTAARRRDKQPSTAYWLWRDGEPRTKSATMHGIKQLAHMYFGYETYVWDAEQWDRHMEAHPEIGQKLKELGIQ